jgi:hypothetical protein
MEIKRHNKATSTERQRCKVLQSAKTKNMVASHFYHGILGTIDKGGSSFIQNFKHSVSVRDIEVVETKPVFGRVWLRGSQNDGDMHHAISIIPFP